MCVAQVTNLSLGQRVASPFTANCGACFYCSAGATCRCQHAQARLFGWIDESEVQVRAGAGAGARVHYAIAWPCLTSLCVTCTAPQFM